MCSKRTSYKTHLQIRWMSKNVAMFISNHRVGHFVTLIRTYDGIKPNVIGHKYRDRILVDNGSIITSNDVSSWNDADITVTPQILGSYFK